MKSSVVIGANDISHINVPTYKVHIMHLQRGLAFFKLGHFHYLITPIMKIIIHFILYVIQYVCVLFRGDV